MMEMQKSDTSGESQIRILLADDHHNVRVQMGLRLGRERDFRVVAEALNSSQVVDRALALRPQIALIDPMMRDGLGLETVGWVASHLPEINIVVLTAYADTAFRMELRKMGVRRILNKGVDSSELVATLRDIGRSDKCGSLEMDCVIH